jgi:transketolase
VKAVDAKYETLGELAVKLEDIRKFRELGSKCPMRADGAPSV